MSEDNKIGLQAFTELVAKRAGTSNVDADVYVHQLARSMAEGLENGSDIHLYRFGRFHTVHVDERAGHDPNSGEPLTIPDHTRVHFRPYGALRYAVNAPFRQLRIKELTADKTAWRLRASALILLALLVVLLILLGFGIKSLIFTEDAPVMPAEQVTAEVEPARAVDPAPVTATPEPATETTAPAEEQTISAPAIVAAAPAEPPPPPMTKSTARMVSVSAGDTLWAIAETAWGDPYWWPVIYVENRPELFHLNPDNINVGIILRIPVLDGSVNDPSAADLRLKTEAYQIVADDYHALDNPRATDYAKVADRGFNK